MTICGKMLTVFLMLLSACATHGRFQLDATMSDELSETRESISQGSTTQAIRDLTMMLELDPRHEEALFLRALASQKKEAYAEALADYRQLLTANPKYLKAHFNAGMILAFHLHDTVAALEHFDAFLTIDPTHAKAPEVAGIMCSLDPKAEIVQRTMKEIELLEVQGEKTQAIERYRSLLAEHPTLSSVHLKLGRLLQEMKQVRASQNHLMKAALFSRVARF
ncbi:MAG: tetratricopeptide repeat protein [Deltaproteobacteria bacterium]|nr:tetratricopeptide repeat protein [Deltaproteobacteria bacterium]